MIGVVHPMRSLLASEGWTKSSGESDPPRFDALRACSRVNRYTGPGRAPAARRQTGAAPRRR